MGEKDFPGGSVVKNPSANAGDIGDEGLIPRSGRSLEEEIAIHSSILTWKTLWTEEPGGLQSMGLQRVWHDLATKLLQQIHVRQSNLMTQ